VVSRVRIPPECDPGSRWNSIVLDRVAEAEPEAESEILEPMLMSPVKRIGPSWTVSSAPTFSSGSETAQLTQPPISAQRALWRITASGV
jgi:hypothetical protein